MKNQTKAAALGIVLSGAFLTGCGMAPAMDDDRMAMLESKIEMVQQTADDAFELARMAIACCDANSHRLNTMTHNMQKK